MIELESYMGTDSYASRKQRGASLSTIHENKTILIWLGFVPWHV